MAAVREMEGGGRGETECKTKIKKAAKTQAKNTTRTLRKR